MTNAPNHFLRDLVERVLWTFVQGFTVSWSMAEPVLGVNNMHAWKAALVGAAMGGVSAVKSILAKPFGDPQSASILPSAKPAAEVQAEPQGLQPQPPVEIHLHGALADAMTTVSAQPVIPVVPVPSPPLAADDYDESFDEGPLPDDPMPRIAGQVG